MNTPRLLTTEAVRSARADLIDLLGDAVAAGASVGFVRPLDQAAAQHYWETVIQEMAAGSRLLLAVEAGGRIVGSVQLGLCMRANGRHRAEVQKLLVHTHHRRQGWGRRLMEAAESEARRAGRTLLYLDTEPGQPAATMYARLGWTLAGEIPDYACSPDGVLHGTQIFYKKLGAV